jgi:hypothetical protein
MARGDVMASTYLGLGAGFVAGGDLTGTDSSQTVVSLTGSGGVVTGPATALKLGGASVATAGLLRIASAGGGLDTTIMSVRNNANGANIDILQHIGSTDEIRLGAASGSTGNIAVNCSSTFTTRISGSSRFSVTASATTIQSALVLTNQTTSTSATAGSNGDVPAQVDGYVTVSINGANKKIPYYV